MAPPPSAAATTAAQPEPEPEPPATLPLFLASLPVFPGQPVSLYLWEPRYLLLVERVLRGRRRFGMQLSSGKDAFTETPHTL